MKKVWVRAIPWDKKVVTTALESGADGIMVPKGFSEKVKRRGKNRTVSQNRHGYRPNAGLDNNSLGESDRSNGRTHGRGER